MTTVGVLGLGKLGLPLALVLNESTRRTLVWDADPQVIDAIRNKQAYIDEPFVEEMLARSTLEIAQPGFMCEMADVIFIIVPTPSKIPTGEFDTSYVRDAIMSLCGYRGVKGPIIACVSTVSPGSCDELADLAADNGMGFVYSPTMIALGSVVHNLMNADVQLIGERVGGDGAEVIKVWNSVSPRTKIHRMSYTSAELSKIASNAFSTFKITFANTLARMCDLYPNADIDDVTQSLGDRKHIGHDLLTAGAGYGGPCFPRDTAAFDSAGATVGAVIAKLNDHHVLYVANRALEVWHNKHGSWPKTFAVLGRNYKEGSNYRIESFGDKVFDRLNNSQELSPVNAREADVVIIAMPLRSANLCEEIREGAVVMDVWRTHSYLEFCPVTYVRLGHGPTT